MTGKTTMHDLVPAMRGGCQVALFKALGLSAQVDNFFFFVSLIMHWHGANYAPWLSSNHAPTIPSRHVSF